MCQRDFFVTREAILNFPFVMFVLCGRKCQLFAGGLLLLIGVHTAFCLDTITQWEMRYKLFKNVFKTQVYILSILL
jgi:hypothetical protein